MISNFSNSQSYILPEMASIFDENNRYQLMLDITVITCEAMADIGQIPQAAWQEIRTHARYDTKRIAELESELQHNTTAFLQCLAESVNAEASRYLYQGICSADLTDLVTALQIKQIGELLHGRIVQLRDILVELAKRFKFTLMMGRTHGTYAEPITFGLKMAVWIKELERCAERLGHARVTMMTGKLNGAVGSFSSLDPRVEMYVCRRLNLHPASATTQILQRDRIGEFITTLALISCSIEKFANEIRNLQRTEIHEVEEHQELGQAGSLSLPHKQRPYQCETISGLARVMRGFATAAMEDIAIWHEQDASYYTVERIIVPDSCILLDYMLYQFTQIMQDLHVYPENMQKNIDKSLGLVFSQRILLALLDKGVSRNQAYEMLARNAKVTTEQGIDFQYLLLEDKEIGQYLTRAEIMERFDYSYFTANIDYIFERANI